MSDGPVVLGYDGSDLARAAIATATRLVPSAPVVALTVWESAFGFVHRHHPPESFEIARDLVDEFDRSTRGEAERAAEEGAALARECGASAEALARPTIVRHGRDTTAVWRVVVDVADELDARMIVLGSRGRSGIRSAVLGSVSQGVVTAAGRPVLIVPPTESV